MNKLNKLVKFEKKKSRSRLNPNRTQKCKWRYTVTINLHQFLVQFNLPKMKKMLV